MASQHNRFEKIIQLKLEGRSNKAIAALMNIKKTSLYAILKDPDYLKAYEQVKREALTQTLDSFVGGGLDAMQLLRDAVNDIHVSVEGRISLAQYMINNFLRFAEAAKSIDDDLLVPDWRKG
jgi:hypothetical protein